LIKERDDIRNNFTNLKANMVEADDDDEELEEEYDNVGIYEGLIEKMNDLSNNLSELRKGAKNLKELVTQDVS